MKSIDPVDRAFELLREESAAELPSPELEATLRARHAERRLRGGGRLVWRAAAVLLVLASGVFAASGGVEWLWSWWFSIEVEGQHESGTVGGDGEREFTFATEDGGTATVRVARERLDGGEATRIAVDREGPGRLEHERVEDRVQVAPAMRERFAETEIEGSTPIYSGIDQHGTRVDIHVLADGWTSSRVVVHRHGDGDEPIELISRVPFVLLRDGMHAEVTERADGGLRMSFSDGRGAQFDLMWGVPARLERRPTELQTPDGKIRVRVAPDRTRR